MMLVGKGWPRAVIGVALVFTLLIGFHLSSLSSSLAIPKWRLPASISEHFRGSGTSGGENQALDDDSWVEKLPSESVATTTAATTSTAPDATSFAASATPTAEVSTPLPCEALEGADDVLVVMRTGATEINDKLPVHLNSTFRCYSHVVIFSDYEEEFQGWQVHDVLRDMPDEIKQENQDFRHYQHILDVGRNGLDKGELSGHQSYESGPIGKGENAGWALDKWKFLPMINQTLALHPDKKWYVFVEPDTYLVWSSLLQWLPKLDADKPLYAGSEVMIGDDIFAHGGSAFLISRPALEKGVELYNNDPEHWHEVTDGHWAGDCVLGVALKEAGVDLTWAWPMIQGGNPSFALNWEDSKSDNSFWCSPAISYHHFSSYEIEDFWNFEQYFLRNVLERKGSKRDKKRGKREHPRGFRISDLWNSDDMSTVLHHRDTFKEYVLPNITMPRTGWNNRPDFTHPETENYGMAECRRLCEEDGGCLQYALGPEGCATGEMPLVGQSEGGVESGWMIERVEAWVKKQDHCWGRDHWYVTT